jgi:broad specificity phosphatase PhoE
MAVQIVYETHSTSIDNERRIATGWLPGELSEEGLRQAGRLGERRRDDGIDAVLTSDLRRAVQTCEVAFRGTGLPITQDVRLRECDYGSLNGAPAKDLLPRARFVDTPFPGGQSYRDIVDQTRELLDDIAARYDGGRILIVAHSANRWALQCLLDGARLEDLVDAPFDWQEGWEFSL